MCSLQLTSYIALSPFEYEGRIGDGREPNVVANVNTTQNQQLRSAASGTRLRVRLLGPMTITSDDKPVAISSKKARALLGYLALREGNEVARSALTGLLWGERSESQARASLR
jgi:two-component SAPR family response regulator